jgi:hypothetical protein
MRAKLNQVANGLIVWNQPKSKVNWRSNLPDLDVFCDKDAEQMGRLPA